MKKTLYTSLFIGAGVLASAFPAFAADVSLKANVSATGVKTTIAAKMDKAAAKGDAEIEGRVDSLGKLSARVGEMKRLTDTQKSSVNSQIQTLVGNLTNLKAKIDADATATGSSTLKDDMQSITLSYRVYALIFPQINILTAVDRIGTITNSLNTIGAKLQTRLTAAETAGKDVASLKVSLADYAAKMTDANTQTQASLNLILPLVPDNGDKTIMASNKTALMNARADIKKAIADITAARKDGNAIIKALASMHLDATANASTTVKTSSN